MRVIEIGCGPGAAARAVAERIGPDGHVLAVDRSDKAIAQLTEASGDLIRAGRLTARCSAIEDLEPEPGEELFDLAFAIRVGAFDGRHPSAGERGLRRLAQMLTPGGSLYIDGGDPLRRIELPIREG
jgi:SAM-dependent methyltransferase